MLLDKISALGPRGLLHHLSQCRLSVGIVVCLALLSAACGSESGSEVDTGTGLDKNSAGVSPKDDDSDGSLTGSGGKGADVAGSKKGVKNDSGVDDSETDGSESGVDSDSPNGQTSDAAPSGTTADCDDLLGSFVRVQTSGVPPFDGTLFVTPDILTDADPTSFVGLEYVGQQEREMFDRRTDSFEAYNAHLFNARFGSSKVVEVQVNPEFDRVTAEEEALLYATAIGRIPGFFFRDLETVWIHDGSELAGGGNNNLLIHTVQGQTYIREGILEELFLHEGAHTSLDSRHAADPAWLAAQKADGTFLSTYAQDNPNREDVSESIGLWLALRFFSDRIDPELVKQVEATIPNRLRYFDCAGLSPDPLR